MIITLITTTKNSEKHLARAIDSVNQQNYPYIDHIIIDSVSIDQTLAIAKKLVRDKRRIFSEPDENIYEGLNKGIVRARGDIIGIIHSDDYLADATVLRDVVNTFKSDNCDFVYSNLEIFQAQDPTKIIRSWTPGPLTKTKIRKGWAFPHPTLFIKKHVIDSLGLYDEKYEISADYEFTLRLLKSKFRGSYLNRLTYKMQHGGASTTPKNFIKTTTEDLKVIRSHGLPPLRSLLNKKLSKLQQFGK